jgi:hypothetical protein
MNLNSAYYSLDNENKTGDLHVCQVNRKKDAKKVKMHNKATSQEFVKFSNDTLKTSLPSLNQSALKSKERAGATPREQVLFGRLSALCLYIM